MRAVILSYRLWLVLGGLLLLLPAHAQFYSDISPNDLDRDSIDDAAVSQLMEGFPDGAFHPESPMTRADGVMVMARMLNLALKGFMVLPAVPPTTMQALPVSATHWVYPAARFLADHGVFDTGAETPFIPGAPLTRGELLSYLSRLLHAGRAESCAEMVKELAANSLLPAGWEGDWKQPVIRREAARLLDQTLDYLIQSAVAEGRVTAFETDGQGDRWVHLQTVIGEARLMLPTGGVIVQGGAVDAIHVGVRIRTLSDVVSGTKRKPYFRVREVTILS